MKYYSYLVLLVLFINQSIFANDLNSQLGQLEKFTNAKIIAYYQQTQEIKRQQALIDAKLTLLKRIDECKKLGFNCIDNANLNFSTLKALPKLPVRVAPIIKPVIYPLPKVLSIVNKVAVLTDYNNKSYKVSVGDKILNYEVIAIDHNSVTFKNTINNKVTIQKIIWQ